MAQRSLMEPEARPTEVTCRHHWIIESPRGATSRGVCKKCGAVREFRNSLDETLWEREDLPEPRSARWDSPLSMDIYPHTSAKDLWDDDF